MSLLLTGITTADVALVLAVFAVVLSILILINMKDRR